MFKKPRRLKPKVKLKPEPICKPTLKPIPKSVKQKLITNLTLFFTLIKIYLKTIEKIN